jgi:hypothetical protein
MKNLVFLGVFVLSARVPSFAAEHVVTHSAKVVSKDTYKVAKALVKDVGKAGAAVVTFIV